MQKVTKQVVGLVTSVAVASASIAPAYAQVPNITRSEYEACHTQDEQKFRAAVEAVTLAAMSAGIKNIDYGAIVRDEWRRQKFDALIDARVGLAITAVRQETSWGQLLKTLAYREKAKQLAVDVAERVYRSDALKAGLEKLALGVGRQIGKAIELTTVDASLPAQKCLRAFLGPRYGDAVAGVMAQDAAAAFKVDATSNQVSVSTGAVVRQASGGLAGAVILVVRRQLARMAQRLGQRLVGSVLSRVVAVVATGVGLVLIAKDAWDFRHGVLPIIAAEMKAPATKAKVREELSSAIMRHIQLMENEVHGEDLELEIRIDVNEDDRTFTISDTGIGLTREEIHENLGTIAHSGSKQFVKALEAQAQKESSLIGQFGVGFYSAFMVADEVKVYTHSWKPDGEDLEWTSDGRSGYEIEVVEGQQRGARVEVKLKEEYSEFAEVNRIKSILENYSAFVSFPILLNGERVNTVEAIWRKQKSDISDEEYNEFYKFAAKAMDDPQYRMHFSADAPIELNALIFVPTENTELFGFGQMEPGVSLYCKNVLIDNKPEGLLPDWARFLRGVIDSADLPLNISRESMQDSALVQRLNRAVIKKFTRFLNSEAKEDPERYAKFYDKFSRFLKEGIVNDFEHRDSLAKLIRFETSMTKPGETCGLEDYLTRAKEGQDKIYYLITPDRASAEAGSLPGGSRGARARGHLLFRFGRRHPRAEPSSIRGEGSRLDRPGQPGVGRFGGGRRGGPSRG